MFAELGRAVLRAMSVTLSCKPSLAELGNLGTVGRLSAVFALVLENCEGRENDPEVARSACLSCFWVVSGSCFVLNISNVYLRSIKL